MDEVFRWLGFSEAEIKKYDEIQSLYCSHPDYPDYDFYNPDDEEYPFVFLRDGKTYWVDGPKEPPLYEALMAADAAQGTATTAEQVRAKYGLDKFEMREESFFEMREKKEEDDEDGLRWLGFSEAEIKKYYKIQLLDCRRCPFIFLRHGKTYWIDCRKKNPLYKALMDAHAAQGTATTAEQVTAEQVRAYYGLKKFKMREESFFEMGEYEYKYYEYEDEHEVEYEYEDEDEYEGEDEYEYEDEDEDEDKYEYEYEYEDKTEYPPIVIKHDIDMHYQLKANGTEAEVRAKVEALREVALGLSFEEVGEIVDLSGEECSECDLAPGSPDGFGLTRPERAIAFSTKPFRYGWSANIGLCRYPGKQGWIWDDYFRQLEKELSVCQQHLPVVAMLKAAKKIGFEVGIEIIDDGESIPCAFPDFPPLFQHT